MVGIKIENCNRVYVRNGSFTNCGVAIEADGVRHLTIEDQQVWSDQEAPFVLNRVDELVAARNTHVLTDADGNPIARPRGARKKPAKVGKSFGKNKRSKR